jgi:hypothetical protein
VLFFVFPFCERRIVMTQTDLDRAVARVTGEPVATIAQRGFSLCRARPPKHRPATKEMALANDWHSSAGLPTQFGIRRVWDGQGVPSTAPIGVSR